VATFDEVKTMMSENDYYILFSVTLTFDRLILVSHHERVNESYMT